MKFEREHYIRKLISSKHNHLIKIITGLRRVGKSYLSFNLYKQHLLDNGVDTSHIIEIHLTHLLIGNIAKQKLNMNMLKKWQSKIRRCIM